MDSIFSFWPKALITALPVLCLLGIPARAPAALVVLPAGEIRMDPGKGLAFDVMIDAAQLNDPHYPWSGGSLLGVEFTVLWNSSQWTISQATLDSCGRTFSQADPLCSYTHARTGGAFDRAVNFRFIAGYAAEAGASGPIPLATASGVISFRAPVDGFVVSNREEGVAAVEVSLYELVLLEGDGMTVDICNGINDWCGFPVGSSHPLPRSVNAYILPAS